MLAEKAPVENQWELRRKETAAPILIAFRRKSGKVSF
jgi:hypothetical protein